MSKKNPILYEIDGIPIRAINKICMQFNENDYVKVIKSANSVNIGASALLRIMASPCSACGNDKTVIPLTIMPKKIGTNGRTISSFHKKNEEDHG
jgi:hypothetical protein